MKVNTKVFALMAALAAGVAGAQTTTPPASSSATKSATTIDNIATASFSDPANPGSTIPLKVDSNTVTTTVLPKPGFDIVYRDGTDSNTGTPTSGGTAATASTASTNSAVTSVPQGTGGQLVTPYYLVNNGNTDQTITLAANTEGSTSAPTVTYYLDTNGDGLLDAGDTQITGPLSVSLPYNTTVAILQVIKTPTSPAAGNVYAATPVGTGEVYVGGTTPVVTQSEVTANLGLQFARIDVVEVNQAIGPNGFPTGSATGTYTSPTTNGSPATTITMSNDSQTANLAPSTANGVVTFDNTVKNTAPSTGLPDDLTIHSSTTGTTYYTNAGVAVPTDGTTTVPVTTVNGNTVQLKVVDGDLVIVGLLPGDSVTFQDSIPYTPAGSTTTGTAQDTTLTVTSKNDPTKTDTTTNTIYAPVTTSGVAFGDPPSSGDPVPGPVGTPPTGVPGNPGTPVVNDPATCTTGTTSYVLMQIKNTGNVSDTFTVTGTAPIRDNAGTLITPTPTIAYYIDNGPNPGVYDSGDTALVSNTTPTIDPGNTLNLIGVVLVPCTAGNQTITLNQTATSTSDPTKTVTDDNDTITVGTSGNVFVAKFTQAADPLSATTPAADSNYVKNKTCTTNAVPSPNADATIIGNPAGYTCANTSFVPGTTYSYKILAKNTYNGVVTGFSLTDDLTGQPFNLGAADVTGSCSIGTFNYDAGTRIAKCDVGTLPAAATATMTINVTIK